MDKLNELILQNNALKEENIRLKKENAILKEKLKAKNLEPSQHIPEAVETSSKVHNNSLPAEKIELFMSLFKGRDDVFAKRWHSVKTEKSGYQPVCENEWDGFLCDKQKFKCSSCPNRKLSPLTEKHIYSHLSGKDEYARDVVGIYPMLLDETCCFLAVDFDDGNFKKDVLAFKNACDQNEISASIEISRSGTGAHVWIFFEDKVPAYLARKLGSGLLTYAMNKRSELKFSSYDRLFPNQDIMPNGGFGNLIALPLQGKARKNNCSVFVDDTFTPYQDQWRYLSNISKISAKQVEAKVKILCKVSDLGQLITAEETDEKPWEQSTFVNTINIENLPTDAITITKSNMLYIEKNSLSSQLQNRIKRFASFKNPEFYKSQVMRLSTYNKPRIISLSEDISGYIAVPRGAESSLVNLFETFNISYNIDDKTNKGNVVDIEFNGDLRENQKPAVAEILKHDNGVLSATTAFGKTVVASNIIATRKTNTLILVHTQSLLNQWEKSLSEFLTINHSLPELPKKRRHKKTQSIIGKLGGGKNTLNGIVDVAIMQSLVTSDDVKDLVKNYGQIIVDECHHTSAVNFEKILKHTDARYVLGLTATPVRQDGHHPIIFLQCGDIRYKVDAKTEALKRDFEHFIIPRFTSIKKVSLKSEESISTIYNDLMLNDVRNTLIVNDIVSALEKGRCPIVLTERTEHIEILKKMLCGAVENLITLSGKMSLKEKRLADEKLKNLKNDDKFAIIATGKYVGEGFDFPRLDTLFLAMPIAWKGKVAQYAGRLHRDFAGKQDVLIYDYVDIHIPVLERMYHKRVKGYRDIGYKAKDAQIEFSTNDIIYDSINFTLAFNNDIIKAEKEILVFSPFMRKYRVLQMIGELSKAILNNVQVTVVTRPPEDFKEKDKASVQDNADKLKEAGIKVIFKSNIHQKFAIIDNTIVWYGSINLLSYGGSKESIMRISNADIANELYGLV